MNNNKLLKIQEADIDIFYKWQQTFHLLANCASLSFKAHPSGTKWKEINDK